MGSRVPAPLDVAALVDSMFGEVLTLDERAELLAWIHAWETENPGVTPAERVTGWIDVAYAFQERGVSLPSGSPPTSPALPAQQPAV